MHPRKNVWHFVTAAAAAAVVLTPIAPVSAAPLGTEFTYQGTLSDGSGPANGSYDLRFILYTADSGGSQVGSTVTAEDLTVADGRVVTNLDFGAVFTGDALWLEVAVRDGASTGGFTVLSPRQPLTAAPYAQHAATAATAASATSAGFASSAGDTAQLNGQNPSYYLAWANLTGVPAGLADGDDDTLAGLTCGDGQVVSWSGGAWICADAADALASTFVVSPGANAVASGTALLAAAAALPAASETAPLLLKLEPGVYDLGAGQLTLPEWVDLEGSGRNVTTIKGATCGSNLSGSTLVIAGRSELRGLTVENTCATINVGIAVHAGAGARITGIHAISAGNSGNCVGINPVGTPVIISDTLVTLLDGAGGSICTGISADSSIGATGTITLENVQISASGDLDILNGIYAVGGASLSLRDVSLSVTGSSSTARGLYVYGAGRIDARGLAVETSTTGGVAGQNAVFIEPQSGAEVVLKDLWVRGLNNVAYAFWAEGGGSWSINGADFMAPEAGMVAAAQFASGGTFIISGSTMRGGDSGLAAYIEGSHIVTVEVTNSIVQGPVNAAWTNVPSPTVRIGGSMLSGGPVSGNFTCGGVWDENSVFYLSSCP